MGYNHRKVGAKYFWWRGEIMQFDYLSSKNAPKHKRFERLNSNKK
jgi:hypothetical protein